jgi:hypothetical protein
MKKWAIECRDLLAFGSSVMSSSIAEERREEED